MALGNLAQRALVAVVAVPLLLLLLNYHRPEPTWAVIFIASLIAMHELFAMVLPKEDRGAALVMGGLACAAFYWLDITTLVYLAPSETGWTTYTPTSMTAEPSFGLKLLAGAVSASGAITLILVVVVPMLYFLFRHRMTAEQLAADTGTVARRITGAIMGIVYAGLLTTFLAILKRADPEHGASTVLIALIVAWVADTGGYFAGRFLGNTKLYPAVSPKKTWAGAWGGLAGAVVGLVVLKLVYADWMTWVDVFAIAIPGCILGQMGDLAESLLKRSTGVKDSGALLPGHGGILDRIDAVLFIAPYVYVYLQVRAAIGSH
jgi:phosphatidate cytidylyltransferase